MKSKLVAAILLVFFTGILFSDSVDKAAAFSSPRGDSASRGIRLNQDQPPETPDPVQGWQFVILEDQNPDPPDQNNPFLEPESTPWLQMFLKLQQH